METDSRRPCTHCSFFYYQITLARFGGKHSSLYSIFLSFPTSGVLRSQPTATLSEMRKLSLERIVVIFVMSILIAHVQGYYEKQNKTDPMLMMKNVTRDIGDVCYLHWKHGTKYRCRFLCILCCYGFDFEMSQSRINTCCDAYHSCQ